MSTTTVPSASTSFAEAAVPLLIEYTQKLEGIGVRAQRIRDGFEAAKPEEKQKLIIEYENLVHLFYKLKPAITGLAQHVSQKLEHGTLEELPRLELMLRLAEFEHVLMWINEIVLPGRSLPA